MSSSLIHPRVLVALGSLLISAGLSITAWQGPESAMLVPKIVLAIWFLVALVVLIGEVAARLPAVRPTVSPLPWLMIAVLVAAMAMANLGFLIPIVLLVALTLWLFRVRRPLPLALGTLIIGGGFWFLFHHVLLIRLPSLLTNGVI